MDSPSILQSKAPVDLEKEFFTAGMNNPVWRKKIYNELHVMFTPAYAEDIKKYRNTFWRWFVFVTWQFFTAVSETDAVSAMETQVFEAVRLGIDVWDKLMWYMATRVFVESDIVNFYSKLKKLFFESSAVAGFWKGKEVKITDLVKEINLIVRRGGDSIAQAEFESKLKQIMFPKADSLPAKYVYVNPDESVNKFIDLVVFFQAVEPKEIDAVIDNFLHPENNPAKTSTDDSGPARVAVKKVPASVPPVPPASRPSSAVGLPAPRAVAPAKPAQPKPEPKKLSPAQIKSQIEVQFKKSVDGQFQDLDGVLNRLNQLAEQYHDQSIADLYYFDEKDGTFKWNVK